jgi:phage baseplate assembly protein W
MAITIIQSNFGSVGSGTNPAILTSNVTAGDSVLIACYLFSPFTTGITGMTGLGATWSKVVGVTNPFSGNRVELWLGVGCTTGTHVSVTQDASIMYYGIEEYSGQISLDNTAVNPSATASTTVTSLSVTPSHPNELFVTQGITESDWSVSSGPTGGWDPMGISPFLMAGALIITGMSSPTTTWGLTQSGGVSSGDMAQLSACFYAGPPTVPIVQPAPQSSATVSADDSATFTSRVIVTGNTGTVTFVTTVPSPSPGIVVQSNGIVSTTGALPPGTYKVSGTDSDTNGNMGTWSFTLTVTGILSPGTTTIPVVPTPPTGLEILVPFQIDPATGGIAYLSDYIAIIEQHIVAIVMTYFEERVMLPTYGSPLAHSVFSAISGPLDALLVKDVKAAINQWEPSIVVNKISFSESSAILSELIITIEFSVVPFTDVNRVSVTTGGTITQVIST